MLTTDTFKVSQISSARRPRGLTALVTKGLQGFAVSLRVSCRHRESAQLRGTCLRYMLGLTQQSSLNLSPEVAQGLHRALLEDEICQTPFSPVGKNYCRCVIPKHTPTLFMSKHLFCPVKDNTYSIHVVACSHSAWPWPLTCCEPQSVQVIQRQLFHTLRRRERCYGFYLPFFFLPLAQLVMYPLGLAALYVYFTPFRIDRFRMSRHFNSCTFIQGSYLFQLCSVYSQSVHTLNTKLFTILMIQARWVLKWSSSMY